MCVDLHTHSTYSDGTATPEELVQKAAELKLYALALTDHDTLEGCDKALAAGNRYGVKVISGLEISCIHRHFSLHMLGLGVKLNDSNLHEKLQQIQDGRRQRNRNILAKLSTLGIEISEEELLKNSMCGQAGRPHIARLLTEKKIVSGIDQAFRHYLGKGKPAYSERFCFKATETINFIHKAGGVAVLAHPGKLDSAIRILPQLISELVEGKLDGLEIYYPTHSRKVQKKLHALADQYNLLATGGSDFHGNNRRNNGLAGSKQNICPPDSIIKNLQARIKYIRS